MTKGTSPPIITMTPSFDEKRKLPLKSESFRRNRRASVPVVISRGMQEPFLPPTGGYPLGGNLSAEEQSNPTSPSELGDDEEESEEIRMPQIKVTRSGKRRLKWTTELSELFTKAVEKLGPGAVPSAILDEMGVQGLTRGNISSHLQKYRLEMRQMQLQKQAEEEHLHFNQFHFNHPEAFLDPQGKRPAKLQYPPLAAPSAGSYHYQYDPLLHASDLYPAPEDLNSFMASTASITENRCPPSTTGPFSPTHIQTQPTSPTYHNHNHAHAHPYGVPTSWEGSRLYPSGAVNYPYASYSTPYGCTCACTPGSSTPVPSSSSMPQTSSEL
jgi:SHAQKYF class myb-like DNA-binding protein